MIALDRQIVLDTSVLVYLARDGHVGRAIDRNFGLRQRKITPIISVVTIGEMQTLARWNNWGEQKRQKLQEVVESLIAVEVGRPPVLRQYAEINAWLRTNGRAMGQQNDIWIAATTKAVGGVLLTTDRDFDTVHPQLLEREWIDIDELKRRQLSN